MKVKKFLLKVLNETLSPIRARRAEYEKRIPEVYEILRRGSEAAEDFYRIMEAFPEKEPLTDQAAKDFAEEFRENAFS